MKSSGTGGPLDTNNSSEMAPSESGSLGSQALTLAIADLLNLELFTPGNISFHSPSTFSCAYSGILRARECDSSWVNRANWAHSEGRNFPHSL